MEMRVEEDGKSESHAVMAWIGIETLSYAKACRLPSGLSSRESLAIRQKEAKRKTIVTTIDAVSRSEIDWHAIGESLPNCVSAPDAYREGLLTGCREVPLRGLSCMRRKFHVLALRGRRVSNDPLLPGGGHGDVCPLTRRAT